MSKEIRLDEKYTLGCGLGSWAKSFERGISVGDVRMIDGVLMQAAYVYRHRSFTGKKEINWCPVDESKNDQEHLKKWLAR